MTVLIITYSRKSLCIETNEVKEETLIMLAQVLSQGTKVTDVGGVYSILDMEHISIWLYKQEKSRKVMPPIIPF